MQSLKLGCHLSPPVARDKMLKLREFRTALPNYPLKQNWFAKLHHGLGMYLNDQLGICTCAGKANLKRVWTANGVIEFDESNNECLKDYEIVGGYDPSKIHKDGSNPTDNGAVLSDVLTDWTSGKLFGTKILGSLAVDPKDWEEVCYAMNVGVGLYCGLNLPQCAMDAMDSHQPTWQMPKTRSQGTIIGGHCVIEGAYDHSAESMITGTWGAQVPTSADFVAAYFSEMYLILSPDFMKDGISPAGLNGTAILDAMQQLKNRGLYSNAV